MMRDQLSILIIDDLPHVLEVYEDVLQQFGHNIEALSSPAEALAIVRYTLFDVVLIDAKLPYKNSDYGGLILVDEIADILGSDAVIIISAHNVKNEVTQFSREYPFLPKPDSGFTLHSWVKNDLMKKIRSLMRKQTGFVAMPFGDPRLDNWHKKYLKPLLKDFGYNIRRMDEISTTKPLNFSVFEQIRKAHFLFFYADKISANAFLEAGYALALDKFVVLLASKDKKVPFDVRVNYTIFLNDQDPSETQQDIETLMRGLRFPYPTT